MVVTEAPELLGLPDHVLRALLAHNAAWSAADPSTPPDSPPPVAKVVQAPDLEALAKHLPPGAPPLTEDEAPILADLVKGLRYLGETLESYELGPGRALWRRRPEDRQEELQGLLDGVRVKVKAARAEKRRAQS